MTDDRRLAERLVRAIHEQRLSDEAAQMASDENPVVRATGVGLCSTLERIAASVDVDRFASMLASGGVRIIDVRRPTLAQRHEARLRIDRSQAGLALDVLAAHGYDPHPAWRRGARRSYLETSSHVTVSRTDEWTTVVRLDLDPTRDRLRTAGRLTAPRPADWAAVDLPNWAWRGYRLVRPVRLLLERSGIRRRDHGALEPFLATPTSLIGPLLDLADVGPDDLVADLGCGDGRIVVEAAKRRGCRGLGADHSASLVESARRRATDHGVSDRVEFAVGDATALDLSQVDVVFLFLPMNLAAVMIDRLRDRLRPGARVVCHEQNRPSPRFSMPDRTVPVITEDAVTVAHLWTLGGSEGHGVTSTTTG
ncbi:MAG: SAM-dependent methyltransferase [Ilumatobacteraceae bacterium]